MNPDRDLELDVAKFDFLWPKAYPYYSKIPFVTKFVKKLVADDIIQFGQLFEKAIEVQCGLERSSAAGYDFASGEDAKNVAVRTCNYGTVYSARVAGVHNKIGDLLVSVYERKLKKWYFFRIPNHAYAHISKTSNIEIPFELDGIPRKIPKRIDVITNWWDYEVPTFKSLSN